MKNINALTTEENLALTLSALYDSAGYGRYRMSKFEEYSLYLENKNFLTGENVITFNDLDGRLLALKPDVTLSIVKNAGKLGGVKKLFYNESVYRLDKSQNRYREIGQMGLEAIGALDTYSEYEVVVLALKSLAEIDENYLLDISNQSFVTGLLDGISGEFSREEIIRCINGKNLDGLMNIADKAGFSDEIKTIFKRLITANGDFIAVLAAIDGLAVNDKMENAVDELKRLYSALYAAGFADKVRLDFSIINDTEYYNDLVFAGYVSRVPRVVLSGGRYDKLAGKFSKGAKAIGFAVYMNEIAAYYNKRDENDVDIIVLYDKTVDIAKIDAAVNGLRARGESVLAASELPADITAGKIFRLQNGVLTEVKNA